MGLYELFEDLQKIDRKITEQNEKDRRIPCNVCGDMFCYTDRIELSDGICCPNCTKFLLGLIKNYNLQV